MAITPVAIVAMLVSPLVGRLSSRVAPRVFGVPALLVMAAALFALSELPAEPSFGGAAWRLALLGAGVGAAFPAVTIGSMGSIRGQEVGLGSGIVNMSRQVGFAIGIALFVAVFTGTIDNERKPGARAHRRASRDSRPSKAREIMREEARDAYGKAFLVGGFVVLLGIPFSLTMRRGPPTCTAARRSPQSAEARSGRIVHARPQRDVDLRCDLGQPSRILGVGLGELLPAAVVEKGVVALRTRQVPVAGRRPEPGLDAEKFPGPVELALVVDEAALVLQDQHTLARERFEHAPHLAEVEATQTPRARPRAPGAANHRPCAPPG